MLGEEGMLKIKVVISCIAFTSVGQTLDPTPPMMQLDCMLHQTHGGHWYSL